MIFRNPQTIQGTFMLRVGQLRERSSRRKKGHFYWRGKRKEAGGEGERGVFYLEGKKGLCYVNSWLEMHWDKAFLGFFLPLIINAFPNLSG